MENEKLIYLDNSATTKPSDASLAKMREALSAYWGNPSSVHRAGDSAHRLLEEARERVGAGFNIRRPADGSIIFTSGGSEANGLAMMGSVYAKSRPEKGGSRGKIFISDGEHSSVEASAKTLESDGFTVLRVPTVGGALDLDFIRENADSTTVLMAIMLVNNETGAIYDVKGAADIVRAASPKAFIHCDAVQAYMKMRIVPKALGVDSIAVSAHKIFAPKGAGALYVTADVLKGRRLVPVIYGGGQEGGLRSGTENVPAIAAMGEAAKEGAAQLSSRIARAEELREHLISRIKDSVTLNIPAEHIPNIVNITLPGIKSETMLNFLSGRGICVSAGSACSTHAPGVSRALKAFGLSDSAADSSLRISISHRNTKEELDSFADALAEGIGSLARISK